MKEMGQTQGQPVHISELVNKIRKENESKNQEKKGQKEKP